MRRFTSLADVVEYIKGEEDATGYQWNNDGGDWDIDDILCNAQMYDSVHSEYCVDVETYDIYDENYKGGELLFARI